MNMTALVPIADGSEDIEAVTIIDVLRRAQVEVTVASVHGHLAITASHPYNRRCPVAGLRGSRL